MAGDPAPGRRFDELTDPEIAAALARSPRVMLPMGSIEQHGPHLPTGTDFFAATAIALEVAEHLDALVLPLCPLGVTPMHMPYPGTVSLRPGTLQDVVADIGSSLAAHGAREFVILNWHEATSRPWPWRPSSCTGRSAWPWSWCRPVTWRRSVSGRGPGG